MVDIDSAAMRYCGKVSVSGKDVQMQDGFHGIVFNRVLEVGGVYTLLIDNSREMDVLVRGTPAGRSLFSVVAE